LSPESPEMQSEMRGKRSRKLRPEAAAALMARYRKLALDELYERPVDSLDPNELAQMKAAFFRS